MSLHTRLLATAAAAGLTLLSAASMAADLQKAGTATRTKLFNDIYQLTVLDPDGNLTSAEVNDESNPVEVRIEVLYGGEVPDIPSGWSNELVPATTESQMSDLRTAYQNLSKGDQIVMRYTPQNGTTITLNGETLISEQGFEVANAVLDIWFGQTPVSEDIKNQFL